MGRRIVFLSVIMSLLFIISTVNPIMTENFSFEDSNSQSTSGRSVHYGNWVAHREVPVDVGCNNFWSDPLFDSSSDGIIAMYARECFSGYSDVVLFDVVDLLLIESIEIEQDLNFLQFSPDGEYLALASPENVKIYSTSNWEVLLDEDISNYYIQDMTWSGAVSYTHLRAHETA